MSYRAANWTMLDRLVSYLNPDAGLRRMRARAMQSYAASKFDVSSRGYDAAKKNRRTEGWSSPSTSVVAEARSALQTLRNRSREAVRNDAMASRAISVIATEIVGHGIIPKAVGEKDDDQAAAKADLLWKQWGETTACDADGRHDFYGLQTLQARTIAESGEVLVRYRRRRRADKLPVPLQLQVLEPDFLDTSKDGSEHNGFTNVQGIDFDSLGRPARYWLFREHPGNVSRYAFPESVPVPASEIVHTFRSDRPGQVRGVPWLAPVLMKLRDHADFADATLFRQKLAACFLAFVTEVEPAMAGGEPKRALADKMSPGMIEELPAGRGIEFANPPEPANFGEFSRAQLMFVASGLNVPYEALTGDFSHVNFSSGRMGNLSFQRTLESWRWGFFIPGSCAPLWDEFARTAVLDGSLPLALPAKWTPPRREMVDPTREVSALRTSVRSGFQSLSEGIRSLGYDPGETIREIAEDAKLLDSLGVVVESDARRVTGNGILQSDTGTGGTD